LRLLQVPLGMAMKWKRLECLSNISSSTPPAGPYYDPDLYPDGVINLSTAENSLLNERLIEVSLTKSLNFSSTYPTASLPPVDYLSSAPQVPVHLTEDDAAYGGGSAPAVHQRPFQSFGPGYT
jgi:hypothetical protein